jgi:hypothetical protein
MRFRVNINGFEQDFDDEFFGGPDMNRVAIEAAKQKAIDKWPEVGSAENRRKMSPERKKELLAFLINEYNNF